jgi:hypothetical protein
MKHPVQLSSTTKKIIFLQKWRTGRQKGPVWKFCISVGGKDIKKECRRMNVVEVLCTHVCEWKNDTC